MLVLGGSSSSEEHLSIVPIIHQPHHTHFYHNEGEMGIGGYSYQYIYITKFLVCVCETDVTSPCLHRTYSCSTVSPACKVGSDPLHVYIAPIQAV